MDQEFTLTQALELAVETERLGQRFYERAAERFSDSPALIQLFRALAQDEAAHERSFQGLLESLPADRRAATRYERHQFLRAMAVSEFFRGPNFRDLDSIRTAADALDRAIQLEKDTMVYYQGLKEALGGGRAIDLLIAAEMGHIERLSEARAALTG